MRILFIFNGNLCLGPNLPIRLHIVDPLADLSAGIEALHAIHQQIATRLRGGQMEA
jgi:hypothetical protein